MSVKLRRTLAALGLVVAAGAAVSTDVGPAGATTTGAGHAAVVRGVPGGGHVCEEFGAHHE